MDAFIILGESLVNGAVLPIKKTARIVLVGGCFDVLHLGHLNFLKKAKAEGDMLIVALENDAFIQRKKKRKPFHTQQQRAEILSNLRAVDGVICLPQMYSDECYQKLVAFVKPALIAVTKGDPLITQKRKLARSVGGTVKIVSKLIAGLSSSTITTYARILHD